MLLGITEADGFAVSMIAILALSFSFVLVILVGVIRKARKHSSSPDDLVDEADPNGQAQPAGDPSEKETREPWERSANWWKEDP